MASVLEQRKNPAEKFGSQVDEQIAQTTSRIRIHDTAFGLLCLAAFVCCYAAAMILLDKYLNLSEGVRQLALGGFLLGIGGLLYFLIVRPLRRQINPLYAAARVEKTIDNAKNSVTGYVETQKKGEVHAAVKAAMSARAARAVSDADVNHAVDHRSLLWAGGLLVFFLLLLIVLFFVFRPSQFSSLIKRSFVPFTPVAIASRTQIELIKPDPRDPTITQGQTITVAVHVGGKVPAADSPERVRLLIRHNQADRDYEEIAMKEGETSRDFQAKVPEEMVLYGFWYKVAAGDAETPEYRVTVRTLPLFTGFRVSFEYPKYTNKPNDSQTSPDIRAPKGTKVTMVAETNRVVRDGIMKFELASLPKNRIDARLLPNEPQNLEFRFDVVAATRYRLLMTAHDGEKGADSPPYTINVDADLAPTVQIIKPEEPEVSTPANGQLAVDATVGDDYGIDKVRLRLSVDGKDLAPIPYMEGKSFRREKDGTWPRNLDYKGSADLTKLKYADGQPFAPKEGMVIEYWVEAIDNCSEAPEVKDWDNQKGNVGSSAHQKLTLTAPKEMAEKQQLQQNKDARKNQEKQHNQAQQQKFDNEKRDPQQSGEKQPQDGQKGDDQQPQNGQPQTGDMQKGDKQQPQSGKPQPGDMQKSDKQQPQDGQPQPGDMQKGDKQQPQNGDMQKGDKQQPQNGQPQPEKQPGQPQPGDMQKSPDNQPKQGDKQPQQPDAAPDNKNPMGSGDPMSKPGGMDNENPMPNSPMNQSPADQKAAEEQARKVQEELDKTRRPEGESKPNPEAKPEDRTEPSSSKPQPMDGGQADSQSKDQPKDGTQPMPEPKGKPMNPMGDNKNAPSESKPQGNVEKAPEPSEPKPGPDQQGKNNAGQGEQGKSSAGQDQQGKNNAGKDQQGKNNAGQDQPGKNNEGKDRQPPAESRSEPQSLGGSPGEDKAEPKPDMAKNNGKNQDPTSGSQSKPATEQKDSKEEGGSGSQSPNTTKDEGDKAQQEAAKKAGKAKPMSEPSRGDDKASPGGDAKPDNKGGAGDQKPSGAGDQKQPEGSDAATAKPQQASPSGEAKPKKADPSGNKEPEESESKTPQGGDPNDPMKGAAQAKPDSAKPDSTQSKGGGAGDKSNKNMEPGAEKGMDKPTPSSVAKGSQNQDAKDRGDAQKEPKFDPKQMEDLKNAAKDLQNPDPKKREEARQKLDQSIGEQNRKAVEQMQEKQKEKFDQLQKDLQSDDPAKRENAKREIEDAMKKAQEQAKNENAANGQKNQQPKAQTGDQRKDQNGGSGKNQEPKLDPKQMEDLKNAAKDLQNPDPKKREEARQKLDQSIGEQNRKAVEQMQEKQKEKFDQLQKDLQSDDPAKRENAKREIEDAMKQAQEEAKKNGQKPLSPQEIDDLAKKAHDLNSPDKDKREAAEKALDEKLGKDAREKLQDEMKKQPPPGGDPKAEENLKKEIAQEAMRMKSGGGEMSPKKPQGPPAPSTDKPKPALDIDPKNRAKSAELQLEDFEKNRYNKDLQDRLGWTPEQYEEFLKAQRKRVEQLEKEAAAAEQAGPKPPAGPPDIHAGGGRKVETLDNGKGGVTTIPGAVVSPPGFEDSKKKFQKAIENLQKKP